MASPIYWSFLHTLLWPFDYLPSFSYLDDRLYKLRLQTCHLQPCWIGSGSKISLICGLWVPSVQPSHRFLRTLILGPRSINSSNCTRYFDSHCGKPTIRKGKRIFGVIFAFPWAVPAFITILHSQICLTIVSVPSTPYPILCEDLPILGWGLIPWKTDPTWTKIALIMMQGWLGFLIYVLIWGFFNRFQTTFTKLLILMVPMVGKIPQHHFPNDYGCCSTNLISQYTFNFNNFSIIYLFNDGGTWFCRRKCWIYRYLDFLDL